MAFLSTVEGEPLMEEIRAGLSGVNFEDFGSYQIGAVVATHAGPGAAGTGPGQGRRVTRAGWLHHLRGGPRVSAPAALG